jgi:hypothetical protein
MPPRCSVTRRGSSSPVRGERRRHGHAWSTTSKSACRAYLTRRGGRSVLGRGVETPGPRGPAPRVRRAGSPDLRHASAWSAGHGRGGAGIALPAHLDRRGDRDHDLPVAIAHARASAVDRDRGLAADDCRRQGSRRGRAIDTIRQQRCEMEQEKVGHNAGWPWRCFGSSPSASPRLPLVDRRHRGLAGGASRLALGKVAPAVRIQGAIVDR